MVAARNAPLRPRTSYNFFFQHIRKEIQDKIQNTTGRRPSYSELSKLVAAQWKTTSKSDKAYFKALSARDKRRYALELVEHRTRECSEGDISDGPSAPMQNEEHTQLAQLSEKLHDPVEQGHGSSFDHIQGYTHQLHDQVPDQETPSMSPGAVPCTLPQSTGKAHPHQSVPQFQVSHGFRRDRRQHQVQTLARMIQQPGVAQALVTLLSSMQNGNQGLPLHGERPEAPATPVAFNKPVMGFEASMDEYISPSVFDEDIQY